MEEEGSGTVGLSDETKRTCSGKKKIRKMENGKWENKVKEENSDLSFCDGYLYF